jgi:alpha 1,2-mannosyltransferase
MHLLLLLLLVLGCCAPVSTQQCQPPPQTSSEPRAKAAFVILTRNAELFGMKRTVQQIEDRFNHHYNYPYIFLNDEPFTDEFQEHMRALTSSHVEFGVVPKEHWSYPPWIDQERARLARDALDQQKVLYGGSESYRHMCRFFSGFFFRHPLLDDYEYYWRIEPNVEYTCDIDFDPFMYMKKHGKKYSFTMSLYEYEETIPTLWETVRGFANEHAELVQYPNALDWMANASRDSYNRCHFWSNFEIGALNFFRSKEYLAYFDYLDKSGGFFYERWGDAPVHSIGVALFLKPEEVHYFKDIGYRHNPFHHCPAGKEFMGKCSCNTYDSFEHNPYSCTKQWLKLYGET